MEKNPNQQDNITNHPTIHFVDCTKNKKTILKKCWPFAILSIQDSDGNSTGAIALQLKRPYAKNFEKLAQAILPLNGFIVEKIEIAGGE